MNDDDELPPVLGEKLRRGFDDIFRAPDRRATDEEELKWPQT
jgi:hypothetical protein